MGLLLKERICSQWEQILFFKSSLILIERFISQRSKWFLLQCCPFIERKQQLSAESALPFNCILLRKYCKFVNGYKIFYNIFMYNQRVIGWCTLLLKCMENWPCQYWLSSDWFLTLLKKVLGLRPLGLFLTHAIVLFSTPLSLVDGLT